jgi:hypothetical protein
MHYTQARACSPSCGALEEYERPRLAELGRAVLLTALALIARFKPTQPPPTKNLLTALHSSAINSIRIQRAKQPTFEFEQQNGQWNLISPMQDSGNEVRIGALLNIATKTSGMHLCRQTETREVWSGQASDLGHTQCSALCLR